jgi:hypothetical protein
MNDIQIESADFELGPSSIRAYSRLNYTMWYALAEFVDNSTQSRENHGNIIDEVLAADGKTLKVEINYDRENKVITIEDNSIGMTRECLISALKIAQPTQDSKGRSKYGMGMKTAGCWIGSRWSVSTCKWAEGIEWTADIDVEAVANGTARIPLSSRKVSTNEHYTKIKIWNLNRIIQKRTEEYIMQYLGSMYRFDIRDKKLILLFNGNPVPLPEDHEMAKFDNGTEAREDFQTIVGGKKVSGWFGVLLTGSRKFGGFSLFQHGRQIQGYPEGWKPKPVFGGVDDEGGNSLVSQRLTGEIILDGFDVSHTKDAILFRDTEQEELENFLAQKTQRLKAYATSMRKGTRGTPWSRQKVEELLQGVKEEFSSSELKETIDTTVLPPLDAIQASNKRQAESIEKSEVLLSVQIHKGLTVRVCFQDKTANDPHLTIYSPAQGVLDVIINQQHPYYHEIDSSERVDEIIRQYIYDGVAQYMVRELTGKKDPETILKFKDQLLRAKITRLQNKHDDSREQEMSKISDSNGIDSKSLG